MINKREMLGGGLVAAAFAAGAGQAQAALPPGGFGQVNRLTAKPGSEAELGRILARNGENFAKIPACLGYMLAEDADTPGVFWVTLFWDSVAGQEAAVATPALKAQIAQSQPLVGKFEALAKLKPLVRTSA